MVRTKKKKNFLKPSSIAVLIGSLGAVAVLALVVFDVELFIEESDVEVGSLEVIVNDGDILPKETKTTTTSCTPNEEIPALEEAGGVLGVDIFTCDENNVGLTNSTEVFSKIADTKDDPFQAFLENIGFASIDQFGLATVVTLQDVANNTQTFNSILPVILLSVTSEGGFFLDNADIEFFGVIKNPQTTSLNLDGTVSFFIDQTLIETKRLFTSQTVRETNNILLNVVDVIPPPLGVNPTSFNYEFIEGNFADGSTQVFRVVISQLTGTLVGGGETNFIDFAGTFIAYEMTFTVDETMQILVDEKGEAFTTLKTDSRLIVCGTPEKISTKSINSNRETTTCTKIVPELGILFDVKIFEDVGANIKGVLVGETLATPEDISCQVVDGLERSHDYIIEIEGQQFPVSAPLNQHDFSVVYLTGGGTALIRSIDGGEFRDNTFVGWECVQTDIYERGSSNFGYVFDGRNP